MTKSSVSGLRESTDESLAAAYAAGESYWRNNRPHDATRADLNPVARSCGWHGAENAYWLVGFFAAKRRDTGKAF